MHLFEEKKKITSYCLKWAEFCILAYPWIICSVIEGIWKFVAVAILLPELHECMSPWLLQSFIQFYTVNFNADLLNIYVIWNLYIYDIYWSAYMYVLKMYHSDTK